MPDRTFLRNRKAVSVEEANSVLVGFDTLERLYAVQDEARTELEQATGKPICVDACGRCCENMTPVATRLEAVYTLATASVLPSYTNLKNRALRWATDGGDMIVNIEQARKMPCPFLADDKTCSIYEFRPLQCRNYGVTKEVTPDCPRPLHYTESDTRRMYIGQDTLMGARIRGLVGKLITWMNERNPVMSQVGLFPALIAQELITKEKLAEMPIASSKMQLRQAIVKGRSNGRSAG